MEARKKVRPIMVVLILLISLLLAFCCCISAGIRNFQPFDLRYGIHLVGENSLTGAVSRGDFLLLDRELMLDSGSVVYLPNQDAYQGVASVSGKQVKLVDGNVTTDVVPVYAKMSLLAPVVCFLQDYPMVSYGAAVAFILLLVIIRATAPTRWRKRQQRLIRENFARFGEQYTKEEADLEY